MGGTWLSRTVMIGLENGLHLVPCSRLVRLANSYTADVRLRKGDVLADAKNIFDLMGLAAGFGEQIEIDVSGDGAEVALEKIVKLFESNFVE